jgi:hypothetical protein
MEEELCTKRKAAPQSKYVALSTGVETRTQQNVNYYPTMKMI